MIWGRTHLIEACEKDGLVYPFDPAKVNQASINLTVAAHYYSPHPVWQLHDYTGLTPEKVKKMPTWGDMRIMPPEGIIILPGDFLLLHTAERVRIPPDAAATLLLRSGFARRGGNHCFAGFGDPGFGWEHANGQRADSTWTLEVFSVSPWPIVIAPGDSIVQMIVHGVDEWVDKHYGHTGNYQGQVLPTPAANGKATL